MARSTPSIYSCTQVAVTVPQGSTTLMATTYGGHGDYEVRAFIDSSSYQPILRVPITIKAKNPIKLECSSTFITDGTHVTVYWDSTQYSTFYNNGTPSICAYPVNELTEERGKKWPIYGNVGNMTIKLESGQRPTGEWEIRYCIGAAVTVRTVPLTVTAVKHKVT